MHDLLALVGVDVEAEAISPHANLIHMGYKEAVQIQDACNPSGVVWTFKDCMNAARQDVGLISSGNTGMIARHPITVLFASKIHDLAGLGLSDTVRYGLAYDFASAVAGGQYIVGSAAYVEALKGYYAAWDADLDTRIADYNS